jgi:hypothetical protein
MDCDGRLGHVVDNAMSERGQESGKKKKGLARSSDHSTGPYYTGAEERCRREEGEEEEEEGALLYCSTVLLRRGLVDLCTTRCIPAVTCHVSRQ